MKVVILAMYFVSVNLFATENSEIVQELIKHNSELTKTINSNNELIKKALGGTELIQKAETAPTHTSSTVSINEEKASKDYFFSLSIVGSDRVAEIQEENIYDINNEYAVTFRPAARIGFSTRAYQNIWTEFSYSRGKYSVDDSIYEDEQYDRFYNSYQIKMMYDYRMANYNIHFLPYIGLRRIEGLSDIDTEFGIDRELTGVSTITTGIDAYTVFNSGFLVRFGFGTDGFTSGFGYAF